MANNEITFEDYVKKILGEDIFNKGACPDQYVGKLKELKDGFKREISKKHIEDSYKIIVILESSHKDEYEDDRNKLAPAKGKTGKNIRKYLADIRTRIHKQLFDKF
ncbi:hypothetical protein [Kingella negevensis]|uniref:hypothetical protein n=1 Tax=Kingella negevensis TaxID=1522312 RepID=UPI00254EDDFD|nr:hypothetical protein [Kingella negevensis]MDK4681057.1 hypothetical protein [Kingella negevensis]MDK4683259.1 hypothetical protein [Kingella negevensis]MDK4691609.1 hypothetical protein [Kingella negevensis]MDK4693240.1 hypothetical protein [Kingella negevensis]MDK4699540.1 hypothetical protein [Kingella negevensis]